MDFEFSDDQRLIGKQARTFLQKESSAENVRRIVDSEERYDKALWHNIAELGWLGTVIPEEYDGLGLSYLELAVIAEELGRCLAPVPFSSSVYLATELLLQAGSVEQKQRWLPVLAAGSARGTVALGSTHTFARVTQDHVQLSSNSSIEGQLNRVADVEFADFCILPCQEGNDISLCLVEMQQNEVSTEPAENIDLTCATGNVVFTSARAERLGASGQGKALLENTLVRAAVLFAWEQVGGADVALEQARDYALQRFAFGRSIASFQAIKHKLAQAYVKNTLARSNCYYAIWALQNNAPELERAAAAARVSAIQAYYYASKENIHTHGGMGFTWEFDCHLHYRRAKAVSVQLGGESAWKKRLVSALAKPSGSASAAVTA